MERTAEMTPNAELLRQTLAYIEAHPDRWEQDDWRQVFEAEEDGRCGTAMCFAGWAAQLAGGQWLTNKNGAMAEYLIAVVDDGKDVQHPDEFRGFRDPPSVPVVPARERAQRLLGLTLEQADDLFDADRSLEQLRACVARLIDGDGNLEAALDEPVGEVA